MRKINAVLEYIHTAMLSATSKWLSLFLVAASLFWFSIPDAEAISEKCLSCELQCVTFAKGNLPTDSKWRNISVGSAVGWWRKASGGGKGFVPKKHSLVVFDQWGSNSYGHISFVERIDGNILTVSHANWKCKCAIRVDKFQFDRNRMTAKDIATQKDYRILGFLYVWPQQEARQIPQGEKQKVPEGSIGQLAGSGKIKGSLSGEDAKAILGNLDDRNRYNAIGSMVNQFRKGLTPDELVAVRGNMSGYFWSGSIGQLAQSGKIKGSLSGEDGKMVLGDLKDVDRYNAIGSMVNQFRKGLTPDELVAVRGKMSGYYWSGSIGQLAGAGKIKGSLSGEDGKTILGDLKDVDRYKAIGSITPMLNKNLGADELVALKGNMSQYYWASVLHMLQQSVSQQDLQLTHQQGQEEKTTSGVVIHSQKEESKLSQAINIQDVDIRVKRIERGRKIVVSLPPSTDKASALRNLDRAEKASARGNIEEYKVSMDRANKFSKAALDNMSEKTGKTYRKLHQLPWVAKGNQPQAFLRYGNWCGEHWSGGWSGFLEPINKMDELCQYHDDAYGRVQNKKNAIQKLRAELEADQILVKGLRSITRKNLEGKTDPYRNGVDDDLLWRDRAVKYFLNKHARIRQIEKSKGIYRDVLLLR